MNTSENNIKLDIIENIPIENINESSKENLKDDKVLKKITPEKKREYYLEFKEKNKDKINLKMSCEICGGSYTYFNKSRHIRTPRCEKVKNLRGL